MEDYISTGLNSKSIKLCPYCGIPSELISGCNYVTCLCAKGHNGKSEWCWNCEHPKYQPFTKESGETITACNNLSHNSH